MAILDVLVGRDEECAALDDLVRTVRGGLSRSLVMIGDPELTNYGFSHTLWQLRIPATPGEIPQARLHVGSWPPS